MQATMDAVYTVLANPQRNDVNSPAAAGPAWAELERSVQAALATYSNVHRGSGHFSQVSTLLYEQAREIVLDYLGLDKSHCTVIFCSPRQAALLTARLKPGSYQVVSSQDLGLPLGVRAIAVPRSALRGGAPFEAGGGTARLVGPGWVVWAKTPDRMEPGTPAIVNVIALARALQLVRRYGSDAFRNPAAAARSADDILEHDELDAYRGHDLLEQLRLTQIGRDVSVPTTHGERRYINLDNAASTPTFAPIWATVTTAWTQPATVQQALVARTQAICAEVLHAPAAEYEVIFTANTTEAINLVAGSLAKAAEPATGPVIVNTLLEHNSNELPWRMIPGATLLRLSCDEDGLLDLAELETLLAAYNEQGLHGNQRIKLVAVSGASNVLGVCNDLAEISRLAHRYGAHVLVDAAQLVAHRPIDMAAWGIDYLAFSGHKVYAPFGTGVLVARKGLLAYDPAELEQTRASGEENVGGIAALGKALVLLQRIGLDVIEAEEQALTAYALRGLAQVPGLTIYGIHDPDSPAFAHKGGVIPFNVGNTISTTVAAALAERGGIGIRCGCHCAHLTVKRTLHIHPMLERFQRVIVTLFPKLSLPGVARVSLGIESSAADVDALVAALNDFVRQPKLGDERAAVRQQMEAFAQGVAARVYG